MFLRLRQEHWDRFVCVCVDQVHGSCPPAAVRLNYYGTAFTLFMKKSAVIGDNSRIYRCGYDIGLPPGKYGLTITRRNYHTFLRRRVYLFEVTSVHTALAGGTLVGIFSSSACTFHVEKCIYQIPGVPLEPYIRLSYPINALFYVESVKVSP